MVYLYRLTKAGAMAQQDAKNLVYLLKEIALVLKLEIDQRVNDKMVEQLNIATIDLSKLTTEEATSLLLLLKKINAEQIIHDTKTINATKLLNDADIIDSLDNDART